MRYFLGFSEDFPGPCSLVSPPRVGVDLYVTTYSLILKYFTLRTLPPQCVVSKDDDHYDV